MTNPCETCLRWSECNGSDRENCPWWQIVEERERRRQLESPDWPRAECLNNLEE
jgi:hypothetical protein